jgi:hypothetical protein
MRLVWLGKADPQSPVTALVLRFKKVGDIGLENDKPPILADSRAKITQVFEKTRITDGAKNGRIHGGS